MPAQPTAPTPPPAENPAPNPAPAPAAEQRNRLLAWVSLGVILAAAAALYLYRIGDPIAGYHHANEAFYTNNALSYAKTGLLSPWFDPLDPNNPPLYPWIQTLLTAAGANALITGRLLSVASMLASIVLVYAIGTTLYRRALGIMAAAAFAFMPAVAFVGRNTQVDAMMLALQLGSVLAWLLAVRRRDTRLAAASGALIALAMLTKLSAAIAVPALAVWMLVWKRGVGWVRERTALYYAAALAVVVAPWYLYRTLASAQFGTAQSRLLGLVDPTYFTNGRLFAFLNVETMWLVGPPVAVLALIGLIAAVWKRSAADWLVLIMVAANLVFFAVYHNHSYYALPATPWIALLAARALFEFELKTEPRAVVAAALVLVVMLTVSYTLLGAKKFGAYSIAQLPADLAAAGVDSSTPTLTVDSVTSFNDEIHLYAPALRTAYVDPLTTHIQGPAVVLSGPSRMGSSGIVEVPSRTIEHPVIFGFEVSAGAGNADFFSPDGFGVIYIGPPWRLGVAVHRVDSPYALYRIP